MFSVPLVIGCDLRTIRPESVELLSNRELIALFNHGDTEETITLSLSEVCENGTAEMRGLIRHEDLGSAQSVTFTTPSHDIVVLRIHTEDGFISTDFGVISDDEAEMPKGNPECIVPVTVRQYIDEYDAMLIDVRPPEKYEACHLPEAIDIEYWKLVSAIDILPSETRTHLIVYCSGGKRTAQAFHELKRMKYRNIYCLSSMDEYRALYDADSMKEQ